MGQPNTRRTQVSEGGHTYVSPDMAGVLVEIDARTVAANCYYKITRDGFNLILKTEFFRDAGFTNLAIKRDFTRITGLGGLKLISGIVTTFYEEDGVTVDSVVTTTINRDTDPNNNRILNCASPFTTTEDPKI